jgi:hypothetical protein
MWVVVHNNHPTILLLNAFLTPPQNLENFFASIKSSVIVKNDFLYF